MKENKMISRLKMVQGGMNDHAFATHCGVPPSTMRGYLEGKRKPTIDIIEKIAKACSVTVGWLASGELQNMEEIQDEQFVELLIHEPDVMGIDNENGGPIPIVRTFDDLEGHVQFYCIHCRSWHYHGRGGPDQPYSEGKGDPGGHREAHCITINSPYRKSGVILDIVGKLSEVKGKYKDEKPLMCPMCRNYYSAAFNACSCGYVNNRRESIYPRLAEMYHRISTGQGADKGDRDPDSDSSIFSVTNPTQSFIDIKKNDQCDIAINNNPTGKPHGGRRTLELSEKEYRIITGLRKIGKDEYTDGCLKKIQEAEKALSW